MANPNHGFQIQLQEFEQYKLTEVRTICPLFLCKYFTSRLICSTTELIFIRKFQERRRLRERFPTVAMETSDKHQCTIALTSYERLLSNNDICEGNCAKGRHCPTGVPSFTFLLAALIDHQYQLYIHKIMLQSPFIYLSKLIVNIMKLYTVKISRVEVASSLCGI